MRRLFIGIKKKNEKNFRFVFFKRRKIDFKFFFKKKSFIYVFWSGLFFHFLAKCFGEVGRVRQRRILKLKIEKNVFLKNS